MPAGIKIQIAFLSILSIVLPTMHLANGDSEAKTSGIKLNSIITSWGMLKRSIYLEPTCIKINIGILLTTLYSISETIKDGPHKRI